MAQQSFDPGLTQSYTGTLRRAINKDGSFNVRRSGARWCNTHLYLSAISMSWPKFLSLILLAFVLANGFFAGLYLLCGMDKLQGAEVGSTLDNFLTAFFFSVHTFTTVGYGSLAPKGVATNMIASFEALTGLLGFAIATGLLYGRFSRPSARIAFSGRAIIAPYQETTALLFRIANGRRNILMEIEAKVLLMTVKTRAAHRCAGTQR